MANQRVSPTAWYTAAVWAQRGLSSPALAAATPRAAHWAVSGHARLCRALGLPRVDDALEERHRCLDARALQACQQEGVRQVLEVPAGLASRAQRLLQAMPSLTVVEGDLPGMTQAKRAALSKTRPRHHVVVVDLLAESGPHCPAAAVAPLLDNTQPLVTIMEGLTYYLTDHQLCAALRTLRRTTPCQPGSLLLLDAFLTDSGPPVAQRWAARSAWLRLPGLQRSRSHLLALATTAGWTPTTRGTETRLHNTSSPLLSVLGFHPAV